MKPLKLKKANEFVHAVEVYSEVTLTKAQNGAIMEIQMTIPQEQEPLHPNSSRTHRTVV
jgi:hypothetical protein